jgi:hypothetical protein
MRTENSSNKVLIIIIVLLLIANIGTVLMLINFKKPEAEEHHSVMRNYLKSEVGFNEKQLKDFDTLRADYRAQAKQLYAKMQEDKQANLKQLGNAGFNDSALSVAAADAAADQQNVELNLLRHLRQIRNLCMPAQQAMFDTGFYKVMAKAADSKKKEK